MDLRLFSKALTCAFALAILGAAPAKATNPVTTAVASAAVPRLFSSEAATQKHCPSDTVVCLNIPTSIYHEKGMRWYGRTKHGAYICRKEADAAGDRDTRNGQ
jgi:hypothetical protein